MKDIHQILQHYWGYDQFRPMQEDIIRSVLNGNDTLALLPTGGGKSLCFQVPGMALDGLCLVVSPLIALMKDQVESLRKKGITAFSITAELSRNETERILITAGESNCKFLYVSPERLQTTLFQEYIYSLGISLIAVDEAHCISQWGYDFRPSYLKIAEIRSLLPDVTVIAVTASATPQVQQDICQRLLMEEPYIFRGSFLRPALSFRTYHTTSKTGKIIELLTKNDVCSIIYCRSRKKTQDIAEMLIMQGIRADFYHAGLSGEERMRKQEAWMRNEKPVIVCTNAFGMGIDKPDVRIVIHHDLPDCIENYYQEAGRAGRDGQKSYALLLFNEKDLTSLEELSETRYPSIEYIKNVYRSLVNYLQIPLGIEEEEWRDFDIEIFTERFELPLQSTLYALQQLEQEGWIIYAAKLHQPSRVEFRVEREAIEFLCETQPELETVIKTLLRTYGGILDMAVNISEFTIAKTLGVSKDMISSALIELHQQGVIHYQPKKESPQIRFPESRPVSDEWLVQPQQIALRKQQFESRIQAIINYAEERDRCRSVMLGNYFGDIGSETCGICDNCIAKRKKESIDFSSFQSITTLLEQTAANGAVEIKSLLNQYTVMERERIIEVIQYLMQEDKIIMNEKGNLIFNK
jgi:ATP-dependent DNA helicase RecQ